MSNPTKVGGGGGKLTRPDEATRGAAGARPFLLSSRIPCLLADMNVIPRMQIESLTGRRIAVIIARWRESLGVPRTGSESHRVPEFKRWPQRLIILSRWDIATCNACVYSIFCGFSMLSPLIATRAARRACRTG